MAQLLVVRVENCQNQSMHENSTWGLRALRRLPVPVVRPGAVSPPTWVTSSAGITAAGAVLAAAFRISIAGARDQRLRLAQEALQLFVLGVVRFLHLHAQPLQRVAGG